MISSREVKVPVKVVCETGRGRRRGELWRFEDKGVEEDVDSGCRTQFRGERAAKYDEKTALEAGEKTYGVMGIEIHYICCPDWKLQTRMR